MYVATRDAGSVPQESSAHAELARHHARMLHRRALRLTGNDSDAWDLVQDTWERSLRSLAPELPPERAKGWLLLTLRNRFTDLHRSWETRSRVYLTPDGLTGVPCPEKEEEPAWADIDTEQLNHCVELLSPSQRSVFLLRIQRGLSYAEISNLLGIAEATVGTRLFRALRQLRRLLDQGRPPPLDSGRAIAS